MEQQLALPPDPYPRARLSLDLRPEDGTELVYLCLKRSLEFADVQEVISVIENCSPQELLPEETAEDDQAPISLTPES